MAFRCGFVLLSLLLFGIAVRSCPAQTIEPAQVESSHGVDSEDFYRVYDYETPDRGWFEPNIWTTYIPESRGDYGAFSKTWEREDLSAYTVEVEYGLTDRLSLSTYVDFINAHGENGAPGTGMRFTQGRIEARYRFSQPQAHFFDTAVYAEYHLPAKSYSDSQELETKLILEKNFKSFRLDLNPALSFLTTGNGRGTAPSANLDTGLYYKRSATLQPGLEYYSGFGALDSIAPLSLQQHLLFATADLNLHRGWTLQVGVGYGLTHQSDRMTLKSILSYEFNGLGRHHR